MIFCFCFLKSNFQAKLRTALEWVSDPSSLCESVGEKSLRSCLDDANFIANKLDSDQLHIGDSCTAINSLLNNLCTFTREGKVIKPPNFVSSN